MTACEIKERIEAEIGEFIGLKANRFQRGIDESFTAPDAQ